MDFLKLFITLLSAGIVLIIIGKFLKDKFFKWAGIISCVLTVLIPCISFSLGFIDGLK